MIQLGDRKVVDDVPADPVQLAAHGDEPILAGQMAVVVTEGTLRPARHLISKGNPKEDAYVELRRPVFVFFCWPH